MPIQENEAQKRSNDYNTALAERADWLRFFNMAAGQMAEGLLLCEPAMAMDPAAHANAATTARMFANAMLQEISHFRRASDLMLSEKYLLEERGL
jgi:hypothetical protein